MRNNGQIKKESLVKDLKITIFTRRITILGFIVMVAIMKITMPERMINTWWLVELLLVFWFITTFFFDFLIKKAKTSGKIDDFHFAYLSFELLIITSLVHFIGGVEGIGILFYIFIILYGGIFLSRSRSLFLTIIALVLYSSFILFEYFEIIPHRPTSKVSYKEMGSVVSYVMIMGFTFLFVVYTVGVFAEKLKKRTNELFKTYENLEKRSRDLNKAKDELEEAKSSLEIKVKARTKELEELTQGLEEKVKERTKEIEKKVEELKKFNKLAVDRELKMIQLKKEIKILKEKE